MHVFGSAGLNLKLRRLRFRVVVYHLTYTCHGSRDVASKTIVYTLACGFCVAFLVYSCNFILMTFEIHFRLSVRKLRLNLNFKKIESISTRTVHDSIVQQLDALK